MRRTLGLVALALLLRTTAALLAPVSDDLRGWQQVAQVLARGGNPYDETTRLNWPPLWMLWVGTADSLSRATGLDFAIAVRALPFAADSLLTVLLTRLSPPAGLLYAIHPVALTTTGAQAQFDALPALALLLATLFVLPERPGRDLLAGLLIGIGSGFKTWPLFAAPALAHQLASWRGRIRLMAAAALVPAFLLLPVALTSPVGFKSNVLRYASQPGWWGLSAVGIVFPWPELRALGQLAWQHGRLVLLLALALAWWRARRLLPHEAVLVALLAFVAATPGFGPQYLLWALPFACLARGRAALAWHVATGAAVLVEFFVLPWLPVDSGLSDAAAAIAGNQLINQLRFPAWIATLLWLGVLLFARPRRARPTTPS